VLTDAVLQAFKARVTDLGFELADLRVGGTPRRPHVRVRIDWPPTTPPRGVSVDDCARVSRALEAWLDAGGPLGSRYVLEVSSPGMERPLRWPEQWARFVGRQVHLRAAGLGRVRATIEAVPDATRVVIRPQGGEPQELRFESIQDASLAVDW